jgi:hypothetical protein
VFDQLANHAPHIHAVCGKTRHLSPETRHNHLMRFLEFDHDGAIVNQQAMRQLSRCYHGKPTFRMASCHFLTDLRIRVRGCIIEDAAGTILSELRKGLSGQFVGIEAELEENSLTPRIGGVFGLVKPEKHAHYLYEVVNDLFSLTKRFRDIPQIFRMGNFGIMARIPREKGAAIQG